MRGRKPSVLSLAPSDEDRLHTTAHSDSLPWYQVRRARILLALAAGQHKRDVAAQMECGVATVWRACERYRRDGWRGCSPMVVKVGRDDWSRLHLCSEQQFVELACLEPIAKGLHITIRPARTWLVKPWRTASLARSVLQRFAGCCTMLICSPIAPAIGRIGPSGCPVQKASGASPLVLWECGATG